MDMSDVYIKLIIFLVLMGIGYACTRLGYLSAGFSRDLSKLVVNLFMSATVLNSSFSMQAEISNGEMLFVIAMLTLTIIIGYLIAAATTWLIRPDSKKRGIFELLTAAPNIMFISMPILDQIYGAKAVFFCALSSIPFNIMLYSYGIMRIKGESQSVKSLLKSLVNIPLASTLLATLIFALRCPVPEPLKALTGTVAGATLPISMLMIGTSLGSVSLADSFKNRELYLVSFIRLIIVPLAVWGIMGLLHLETSLLVSCVIMAAAPSGLMVSVIAIRYERDAVYSSQGVLLSTVLSMVTIPVLLNVLL